MSEKYRFEQLDRETRDYLHQARDRRGEGLPGVYVGRSTLLPVVGVVVGFGLIILTIAGTFPPTAEPVKEAMIQTAGLLLGGWLVVAAIRVWTAGKSGSYAGHFVYADPEYLYEARGSALVVTDLRDLRKARADQNFNNDKYQNTDVTIRLDRDRRTIRVTDHGGAQRLADFLNAVAYMRDGGEDGRDDRLRNLSPEAMGSAAKTVAGTGEFPADPERAEEGTGVRVPTPQRERRASTGLFGMAAVLLIGAAMFLGLMAVNYPYRDEAVFARIQQLPRKEQPPALRLYLQNEKFTAHRDEAQKLLAGLYDSAVTANIQGQHADVRRGFGEVVRSLKDKPTAAVSLRVVEAGRPAGAETGQLGREKMVSERLADKWSSTIGDELVAFAALEDREAPVNIDLRWRFDPAGDIKYSLTFRKSPDEEPLATGSGTVSAKANPEQTAAALVEQVLTQSVGQTKIRQMPAFDF